MISLKSLRLFRPAALVCAFIPAAFGVTPAELQGRLSRNENLLIVDVRPAVAFNEGHIPGAINIPVSLLPYKPLPASAPVIVCGDGLGQVDDEAALRIVRSKPGVTADVLSGGYAAWLSETRLTTAPAGVTRERIPGITYDQVVAAAAKSDMVILDVRQAAAPAAGKAVVGASGTSTKQVDPVASFGKKIGVPVVGGPSSGLSIQGKAMTTGGVAANAPKTTRSIVESLDRSNKLLVLVADDEAQANQVARELRARGNYRFTILIGGTEAIRHEGKTGSGRMTGTDVEKDMP